MTASCSCIHAIAEDHMCETQDIPRSSNSEADCDELQHVQCSRGIEAFHTIAKNKAPNSIAHEMV